MKKNNLFLFMLLIIGILVLPNEKLKSQSDDIKMQKITENIYVLSGGGGNVAFLVTNDGVLAIDSKTSPLLGEKIIGKIREITNKDIKYLVFTHYHGDHIQGAQSFPPEAVIISHPNTGLNIDNISIPRMKDQIEKIIPKQIDSLLLKINKLKIWFEILSKREKQDTLEKLSPEQIADFKQKNNMAKSESESTISDTEKQLESLKKRLNDLTKINFRKPQVFVANDTLIHFGGQDIRLFYLGNGHTNGDLIVYFVNQKVLHTGDLLFNKIIPYIDFEAGSDTKNWINIMHKLGDMEIEKVIPGHGDITDKKSLLVQSEYLNDLRNEVQKYIEKKIPLEEIKKKLNIEKYQEWIGYKQRFSINIETVYREMMKDKK